jgi:hypothetical protein
MTKPLPPPAKTGRTERTEARDFTHLRRASTPTSVPGGHQPSPETVPKDRQHLLAPTHRQRRRRPT